MAKASKPGLTKTRLVPPLSYDEAAALNTAFLRDVASNIAAAGTEQSIKGYVAYGPPGSEAFFEDTLPRSIGRIEAWLPNFGDCLYSAIDQLLDLGHASTVVLNSDSPTLPTSLLVETAEALARPGDRAVLGPSIDGGYYLLGLKRHHRAVFQNIAWSTEHVARQTLEKAKQAKIDVHMLPAWYDVDDLQSLNMLRSELLDGWSFATTLKPYTASHSYQLVKSLRTADFSRRLEPVLE